MRPCKHVWVKYSCSLCPPSIMVYCKNCDAVGYIMNYSPADWDAAFGDREYVYEGKGTVTLSHE